MTPLANMPCVFAEEYAKLAKFTEDIYGFKEKREQKLNKNSVEVKKDTKKKP